MDSARRLVSKAVAWNWRGIAVACAGTAVLSLGGFALWLAWLPSATTAGAALPLPAGEASPALRALQPPKRKRPLIAIVGINDATETTDYLLPTGILRRADVADVVTLGVNSGPIALFPTLKLEPDMTTASFDEQPPRGADYVIVPAMSRDDDLPVLDWLKRQAQSGAIIIGVCAGAKVVGEAGLLDGKHATTHWYYVKELFKKHPSARYVPDRRIVVDGRVATTTGITASMPMMLTLIEAVGGRAKAEAVAEDLGIGKWSAQHSSSAFRLTRAFARAVLANKLAVWRHERLGIELRPGMDEVSLALVADPWSRTYTSRAFTFAGTASPGGAKNAQTTFWTRL